MSIDASSHDDPFPSVLDDSAARAVFNRYAARLIQLARMRLDQRTRQKVDPEDVVQSVFRSFFTRQADGRFDLATWDDLWSLLAVITLRKCRRQAVAFRAGRRDVRREVHASQLPEPDQGCLEAAGSEPTPEEVVSLIETVEGLLGTANEVERQIILLRLQGYTPPEIAGEVGGISERKVYRVLAQARKRLQDE